MEKSKTVFFTLLLVMIISFSASAEKKVMVIASYHPENLWSKGCLRGIKETLKEYKVNIHYMNTKRLPKEKFPKAAKAAIRKFISFKPDLVMLGDDNALKLLGPELVKTGLPVVYYGINNNPREYFKGIIPDQIYGVLERPLIFPLLRYFKIIIPNLKKVLVMSDISPSSKAVNQTTFGNKKSAIIQNVRFDLKSTNSWNKWKSYITNSFKDYQAIIVVNHFTIKDKNGKTLDEATVMSGSSRISKIPLFATNKYSVFSTGAVGALVIIPSEHGKTAGTIADGILKGQADVKKHVVQKGGRFFFNKEQMKRFNIKLTSDFPDTLTFK